MVMFFSKHFLEGTVTLKLPRKKCAGKVIFGNAVCNFKVFTNKIFTILAISYFVS